MQNARSNPPTFLTANLRPRAADAAFQQSGEEVGALRRLRPFVGDRGSLRCLMYLALDGVPQVIADDPQTRCRDVHPLTRGARRLSLLSPRVALAALVPQGLDSIDTAPQDFAHA